MIQAQLCHIFQILTFSSHIFMTGSELRIRREAAGLSQEELADMAGMHKNTIYNYENGSNIPKKKITILESALSQSVTKKEFQYPLPEINDLLGEELENTNGNKFIEKPDGSFDIEVSLIPFEAYASYLVSVEEATVHQDFERVVFNVDRYGRGHYQAFKINGNSMNGGSINDVPDGALVLGRELGRHLWKDGFRPADHGFVILSKENIFHKDIIDFDPDTGDITCHSRNKSPEYTDFKLNLNDVYQIFRVIKRQM